MTSRDPTEPLPTPIDPAMWDRLVTLFTEAIALPPADRAAWVAALVDGTPEFRRELAAMVAAHAPEAALTLERELLDRQEATEMSAGTRIGAYRIVRLIGRGGMGDVYLAERSDGIYEHQVAIKILKAGMHGRAAIARFDRERRILARLSHPAVVPLLDGGVLIDGRPYLVLQYVEGAALTTQADLSRLTVPERLRKFIKVCRAVEYAHARLIVHRDLKPSNILLTASGDVRLLDFGIAKLMDEDALGDPADVTRHGMLVMTPERAAPEQLRGEPPTTATDVWALGVLLHELLTGQLPFERLAAVAIPSDVLAEPVRLSRRLVSHGEDGDRVAAARGTTATRLRRAVRGDIDVVVGKALRFDPDQRYQNAGLLADDIEALLDSRPISARSDSWGRRMRRFVLRHRAASAAGLTAIAGIVVLGVGLTWQNAAIRVEAERAAREALAARAVADLLVGLLQGSGPREGASMQSVPVADLLTRGEAQVAAKLDAQPEVQARLWHTLATIRVDRTELPEALTLYERAAAASRGQAITDRARASLLLDYAALLVMMDRRDEAKVTLRPIIEALERVPEADGSLLAHALQNMAEATGGDDGVALAERAVALRRSVAPADPLGLAASLEILGALALRHQRDPVRARGHFREAVSILEQRRGAEHPDMLTALGNLATTLDPPDAVPVIRRLIAAHTASFGPDAKGLAFQNNNLGIALILSKRYAEGEVALREAQARWTRHFGPAHEQTINTIRNIARAQEIQGAFEPARATWNDLAARLLPVDADGQRLATYTPQRAQVLRRLGRYAEATRLLEHARPMLSRQAPAEGSLHLADLTLCLGAIARAQGQAGTASALLRDALAMRERLLPQTHPAIAEARIEVGRALIAAGDIAAGHKLITDALPRFEAWPLAHPLDVAAAHAALLPR